MSNSSKTIIIVLIVFVVIAGIFLSVRRNKSYAPSSQTAQPVTNVQSNASNAPGNSSAPVSGQGVSSGGAETVTVPISAQNNSGETGAAILTNENGKTKVSVSITGEPSGATQPSHIHVGSCANLGAIKYPLSPLVNGKAETTIDASLSSLLNSLPLAINFHKSASELTVYTACGDIMAPSSGAPAPANSSSSSSIPAPAPSSSGTGSGGSGY